MVEVAFDKVVEIERCRRVPSAYATEDIDTRCHLRVPGPELRSGEYISLPAEEETGQLDADGASDVRAGDIETTSILGIVTGTGVTIKPLRPRLGQAEETC